MENEKLLFFLDSAQGTSDVELVLDLNPVEPVRQRPFALVGDSLIAFGARHFQLHGGAIVVDAIEGGPEDRVLIGFAAEREEQHVVPFLERLTGLVFKRNAPLHTGLGRQVLGCSDAGAFRPKNSP